MAVERSGQLGNQLGLKRETSGESNMTTRRASFSIDEEEHPEMTAEHKQSIASELNACKNNTLVEEIIPEVAVETLPIEGDKQLGAEMKTSIRAKDPKKTTTSNAAPKVHTNGGNKAKATETSMHKSSSKKPTGQPAPISTAKTSAASKPSTKSPATPKTPTTPRGRTQESVKTLDKIPSNKELTNEKKETANAKKETIKSSASCQSSKPGSKLPTNTASGTAAKTRLPPPSPQTGFSKPKPRSPTRPIKLPASLTAHTASSGSKTSATAPPTTSSRRSLSRASGNSQATNPNQKHPNLARSPSHASTLPRQPSTLKKGHSRPSLGPPPSQKQTSIQSVPHVAVADEGFLARMMRPTTSSASKTAEKVTTPPKRARSVNQPSTRDGSSKHDVTKGAAPKIGKLMPKPAATQESKSATTDSEQAQDSEALAVEKAEPGIADDTATPEIHDQVPGEEEVVEVVAEANRTADGDPEITAAESEMVDGRKYAALSTNLALESTPDVESTKENPVVVEEPLFTAQESTKHEETLATKLSAGPEFKEEVPEVKEETLEVREEAVEKTENVEAVKKVIDISESETEPNPNRDVDVDIPKGTQAIEDPEDIKAREEIAKLNAEVMRAAAANTDVD